MHVANMHMIMMKIVEQTNMIDQFSSQEIKNSTIYIYLYRSASTSLVTEIHQPIDDLIDC